MCERGSFSLFLCRLSLWCGWVTKIKSVKDENAIALLESCGEKIQRKCQEMRAIFTLGTSQPQRVYSCNFFLSFNHSSFRGFVTLNSEVVGFFFANNLTPTDKGKDTKADGQERTHWPVFKNSLAKHGAKARWPFRLWLNYCLNYIRPDRTKLCHSLLTFIYTTDRCSCLFRKYSFLDIAR